MRIKKKWFSFKVNLQDYRPVKKQLNDSLKNNKTKAIEKKYKKKLISKSMKGKGKKGKK